MAPEKKKNKRAKPLDQDDPLRQTYKEAFPQDILEVMLLSLPVKSLIRFKAVCKSWEATISDRRFSELFRTRRSKSQKNLFLIRSLKSFCPVSADFSLIKLENNRLHTQAVLGNPFGKSSQWFLVNSCNGIVLLRDVCGVYALWNPSIRSKLARIPRAPTIYQSSNPGLYHDSRADDYKVVLLSRHSYVVFSCKTGTWTYKKTDVCDHLPPESAVFVDGSFYWWHYEGKLISFDVEDGKVEVLPHPHDLQAKYYASSVKLMALSGRLCLTSPKNRWRSRIRLWVMERDAGGGGVSWKVLVDMEREVPGVRFDWPHLPICLTGEDDVVMHSLEPGVAVCDHRKMLFKNSLSLGLLGMKTVTLLQCCESLDMPVWI